MGYADAMYGDGSEATILPILLALIFFRYLIKILFRIGIITSSNFDVAAKVMAGIAGSLYSFGIYSDGLKKSFGIIIDTLAIMSGGVIVGLISFGLILLASGDIRDGH